MANEEPIEAAQCSVLSALLTQHLMANSPSSFSCRGVVQTILDYTVESLKIRNKSWRKELESWRKNFEDILYIYDSEQENKQDTQEELDDQKILHYIYFQTKDDKRMYSKVKAKNATKS